jgi:hypothetical protein
VRRATFGALLLLLAACGTSPAPSSRPPRRSGHAEHTHPHLHPHEAHGHHHHPHPHPHLEGQDGHHHPY